jgi:cysteine-rich repeat protein
VLLAHCGDGVPNLGELCDDGNVVDGDGCDSNCTSSACGNGIASGAEACDDGNTTAGDCCSATCALESAGSACAADDILCSADVCDGAGSCTHIPGSAGTSCRPAVGPCDVAESCDGMNFFCPADAGASPGAPCTSDGNPCTLDQCDGVSPTCAHPPGNGGVPCAADGNPCTLDECDGVSPTCAHPAGNAGSVCRAAADECDIVESCDGTATCPIDALQPDGTACDDDDVCTELDQCQSGSCSGGAALNCDDTNLCTQDVCHPVDGCQHQAAPATGCKTAERSVLYLRQKSGDSTGDKLLWKWRRGLSTTFAELQNPTSTASYGLCIYDAGTLLIADVTVPPSTKWTALGDRGYSFTDPTGADDGAQRLLLKASDSDRAKALVKGRGSALPDPPLGALNLPLTVQLINGETGTCFEASYDSADVLRDDAQRFKGRK